MQSFNPMDPEFLADPYPTYHRLRAEDPVHQSPLGFWVLTRYDDVSAVLRDPRFIKEPLAALVEMIATGAVRAPKVHAVAEPRYWLTLWLTDGTTLGRIYFPETGELMGGVSVPAEFARVLERYLGPRAD